MAEGHPGGLREEAYALSIEQQEEVKTPLHSILSPIPHTMGLDPPPHGAYKPLKPPSGALQKILFMGTPHPPSLAQQVEDKASQDAQQDEAQQVEAKNQGGARKPLLPGGFGSTKPRVSAVAALVAMIYPLCMILGSAPAADIAATLPAVLTMATTAAKDMAPSRFLVYMEAALQRAELCSNLGWHKASQVEALVDPMDLRSSRWNDMASALPAVQRACVAIVATGLHIPKTSDMVAMVHTLAEELQHQLSIEDIHGAAMSVASLVVMVTLISALPTAVAAVSKPTKDDIWAAPRKPHRFLSRLDGSRVHPQNLCSVVVSALPVSLLAPDLYQWHKTTHNTIPAVVATFAKHYPEVYAAIGAIPGLQSADAIREAFTMQYEAVFSLFGDSVMEGFMVAMFVFIIVNASSVHRDYLRLILQYYLVLPLGHLSLLRDAVQDRVEWGHLVHLYSESLVAATINTLDTPGAARLSFNSSPSSYGDAWIELMELFLAALTSAHRPTSDISSLVSRLMPDKFVAQGVDESFISFMSRFTEERAVVANRLSRLGHSDCMPSPFALKELILRCARRNLTQRVAYKLGELHKTTDEITIDELVQHYLVAEEYVQTKARDPAMSAALVTKTPKKGAAPPTDSATSPANLGDQPTAGGDAKADKGGKGARNRSAHVPDEVLVDPPFAWKRKTFEARKAECDAYYAANQRPKCMNCGVVDHSQKRCNCKRIDGKPWTKPHVPFDQAVVAAPGVVPAVTAANDTREDLPPRATAKAPTTTPTTSTRTEPVVGAPAVIMPPPVGSPNSTLGLTAVVSRAVTLTDDTTCDRATMSILVAQWFTVASCFTRHDELINLTLRADICTLASHTAQVFGSTSPFAGGQSPYMTRYAAYPPATSHATAAVSYFMARLIHALQEPQIQPSSVLDLLANVMALLPYAAPVSQPSVLKSASVLNMDVLVAMTSQQSQAMSVWCIVWTLVMGVILGAGSWCASHVASMKGAAGRAVAAMTQPLRMIAKPRVLCLFALACVANLLFEPHLIAMESGSPICLPNALPVTTCVADTSLKVGVYSGFIDDANHTRVTIGPDSFSELSWVSPTIVDPSWPHMDVPPRQVVGVGANVAMTSTAVQVPVRQQWQAAVDYLWCHVAPLPHHVDIILGKDALNASVLGAVVDVAADRVIYRTRKQVIQLDSVHNTMARVNHPPLRVLSTSSGCSFVYCTFRNLGFNVSEWIAVDTDPTCREVAAQIVPSHVLNHTWHDVTQRPQWANSLIVDVHLDTSPCQPFSRLQRNPKGLNDPRAEPAKAAAAFHAYHLRANNPRCLHLVENVQFHPNLKAHQALFENNWGGKFVSLNASDYGSPSSRPRNYITNITDLSKLTKVPPLEPSYILRDGAHCPHRVLPCVVASADTYNPPMVHDPTTNRAAVLLPDEAERAQGWNTNITATAGDSDTRRRLVGNSLNAYQMWHILRHVDVTSPECDPISCPATLSATSSTDYEAWLIGLTQSQLDAHIAERLRGYAGCPLHLRLKPGMKPYAKPMKGYNIPAGLRPSIDYAIDEAISKGFMEEVQFSHDLWITQGFCQAKPGRFFEGTDIPKVRLLIDARPLNDACEPAPAHHFGECPTQWDMCQSIPASAKFFLAWDISDAYHSCPVAPECLNLMCVQFGNRLVRYTGGAQGIANMAIHWNIHLADGLDCALGFHWRHWCARFVDDVGIHGLTRDQVAARARILGTVLRHLGKSLSDKIDVDAIAPTMILAGLNFTHGGVCLSNEAIQDLRDALTSYPVRTKVDAQHIIGVINYCNSAFSWPNNIPSAEYVTLMAELTDLSLLPPKEIPTGWATRYPPVRDRLMELITNQPRRLCDPATLLSPTSCLTMVTDASDTGIAVSLFVVNVADASMVTKAHLQDPNISQLIAVRYKKLTGAKKNWHTFETELWALCLGCEQFGKFITTATMDYPPGATPKIVLWSDSTTAISQWSSLTVPTEVTDHLSAKAKRFHGWAEKLAYTKYWPVCVKHIPGVDNDIAHVLSHLGDEFAARANYYRTAGVTSVTHQVVAAPAVHSYHTTPLPDPLQRFHLQHLPFSADEVDIIAEAYITDNTPVAMHVSLSDIYKVATNHAAAGAVPPATVQKVRAWMDERFFVVTPPGARSPLLYATSSATRYIHHDLGEDTCDLTRCLVPVIPMGADVRITCLTPIVEDSPTGHHWIDHDLRRDILLHVHDNARHPSNEATHRDVRALCWFPRMHQYVEDHCRTCSYCLASTTTVNAVGTAVRTRRRFKLIEVDHKILATDVAQRTKHAAVLTLVDVVSRLTMFIPVQTTSARDAAAAIYIRWYPYFGVPAFMRCDNASSFHSALMKHFSEILGIKDWDFSAPNNPTQHATVERRHRVLEHYIDVADSNGDLNSPTDLELHCASAMAACNLEYIYDGHSVMEYVTGAVPRTRRDVVIQPVVDDVSLSELDAAFVTSLRTAVDARLQKSELLRDDAARHRALRRDTTKRATTSTTFDLREGDEVSYEGERYVILTHTASTPTTPMRTKIRSVSHDAVVDKEVLYSALRPMADHRPAHLHSAQIQRDKLVPGAFVFFTDPATPDRVAGGIIVDAEDSKRYMVHECRQSAKRTQFTPLFRNIDTGRHQPRITPSLRDEAVLIAVYHADILAVGSISKKHQLDKALMRQLWSLGVVGEHVPMKHEKHDAVDNK